MTALLDQVQTLLIAGVTTFVGALAVQLARYLSSLIKLNLTTEQLAQINFAAKQGVAAAAESLRGETGAGAQKQELAIRTAASLAPKAFGSLPAEQQAAIVQGTYAQLKPSLATPSSPPPSSPPTLSFPPGTVLQVLSEAPTNIPRPSAVPREGTTFVDAADLDTMPDTPSAKRGKS